MSENFSINISIAIYKFHERNLDISVVNYQHVIIPILDLS